MYGTEYDKYVDHILKHGIEEIPRGEKTKSVKDVNIVILPGETIRRRKDNPLIGFMEGLQFVAGIFNKSELARVAPNANLDLFGPTSSYGLRVGEQVSWIIDELKEDKYSRRAVLVLADDKEHLRERPCTTSMQFYTRNGIVLYTTVTMRSSDAIWGLPYDFVQFGMMAKVIANCLDCATGPMVINIANGHIYESTKHLAKDFEEWKFTIPEFYTLPEYEKWALELVPKLDAKMLETEFNFKLLEKSY